MSPNEVKIRSARPGDIGEMVALLKLLFTIEADFRIDPGRQERGLSLLLGSPRAVVLAAEAQGRVVGMVTGQMVISTSEGAPSLWAEDLVVNPDWQGQGIGRRLMAEVAEWAAKHGATRLQLLVDQGNHTGQAFHQRIGYELTRMICMRKHQD
jgi:GNAT superfamily N-acetyltransferase